MRRKSAYTPTFRQSAPNHTSSLYSYGPLSLLVRSVRWITHGACGVFLLSCALATAADQSLAPAIPLSVKKPRLLKVACFNHPPLAYVDDKTQQGTGFVVELEKRIWESQGYQLQFEFLPLARSVRQTVSGKADLMCGTLPNVITQLQLFPLPIGSITYHAWVSDRQDDWQYQGLKSLDERKLVTIHSLTYAGSLPGFLPYLAQHPDKLKLSGQHPTAQAIRLLRAGRANTLIMDKPQLNFYLNKLKLPHTLKMAGKVGIPSYFYPATSTRNPDYDELQTSFLLGLLRLRESGELDRLRKAYNIPDWGDGGHLNSLQRHAVRNGPAAGE